MIPGANTLESELRVSVISESVTNKFEALSTENSGLPGLAVITTKPTRLFTPYAGFHKAN